MPCPICDQKPMNCDCTPRERAMYRELQERGERPATVILTDDEQEAIGCCLERAIQVWTEEERMDIPTVQHWIATIRNLLARSATSTRECDGG